MPEIRELHQGEPREVAGFRLLGGLGDGGQGSVYLGEGTGRGRVAIKVLHTRLLGDDRARRRFLQEGQTARKVAGFCTAKVHGTGFVDGRPYIVSEFIDGPSLQDARPRGGGALERLAVGTATALAAIHRAGIVHRDFKPSNVLLGPDGPRVIDFGIAKEMDVATTASSVVGTPGYMAPEQIAGEHASAASDMFSWASTVAYAATGVALFGAESIPAVMHRILNAEPDLSAIQEPLRSVLASCLDKEPAKRPTADQVLNTLLGQTAPVEPPLPRRTPVRRIRGRRLGLAVAGVTAVVVAGVAVGIFFRSSQDTDISTFSSYGTPIGRAFGPDAGIDVDAMAVGTYRDAQVVAYADGTSGAIELWNAATGEQLASLRGEARPTTLSMAIRPVNGSPTLFWSSADGAVRSWRLGDAEPGKFNQVCRKNARMSAGDKWLAVGCPDGSVHLLNPSNSRAVGDRIFVKGPVTALAWNAANGQVIVGTEYGYVGSGSRGFLVKGGAVKSMAVVGPKQVAITAGTGTAVYDMSTGKVVRKIAGRFQVMAATRSNGQNVIAAVAEGISVWSPNKGQRLGRLIEDDGLPVTGLAAGESSVAAVVDGRMRAWSLDGAG